MLSGLPKVQVSPKVHYDDSILCLYGKDAQQFMRQPVGAKLTLTLEVVIGKTAIEPIGDGSGDKQPVVELTIDKIEVAKKNYADMTTAEIDKEINDINEGRPESVWTEQKKMDKLRETPTDGKEGKFVYR